MSDPNRYRRGKPGGMYVEKATGYLVIASQIVVDGVAMWVVDPLIAEARVISSDEFAAEFSMPV